MKRFIQLLSLLLFMTVLTVGGVNADVIDFPDQQEQLTSVDATLLQSEAPFLTFENTPFVGYREQSPELGAGAIESLKVSTFEKTYSRTDLYFRWGSSMHNGGAGGLSYEQVAFIVLIRLSNRHLPEQGIELSNGGARGPKY